MSQPFVRYDSSGVTAALKGQDRRPTPPRKLFSQDFTSKLSELEEKQKEQERFNTFLVDQINRLEGSVGKKYSRGGLPSRGGDERLSRLEEEVRRLESLMSRERNDLKVIQQDSELVQMRQFLQEKLTEDHKLHQKHKEKGQVLFGEVVRLGENYEKTNEFLQNLSLGLESRILAIENRVNSGERQVVAIDSRSEGNLTHLMELAEKMYGKIQTLEQALFALGGEHEKNTRSIDRVEGGAFRLQEDMRVFFKQLQTDLQSKIEVKSGDLLNKLLQEQEDRLRTHDDLKYNVELKDKMTQDKLSYDRSEFKSRLTSLESYLKTELQRKEDLIQALSSSLDQQTRNIYETVRLNELNRQEREEQLSSEMANAAESTRQMIEQHKLFQSSITEKVTEMVRTEIDVRQKGEKDLKNLTHQTMKGILQEIAMQKDIIDRLRLKFDHDIQESQKSFSEKADLLSRYIEDEIKRSADLIKSQHNQSKEMITKIAESLKTTILNNEKSKSEIVKKIGKLEGLLQATKTDLNSTLEVTDNRYVSKMRELQQSLENHVMINTRVLETRIETLAGMVESSLSSFEASLLSNREVFSEIINKLNSEISENHSVICRDLQKIVSEISSFQEEIDSLSETVHENLQKTSNFISSIESKSLVLLTNEKIVRENLINRVSEDFDERVKEFEEKVENFEERLNEEEKIQQGNDDKNNEKFKEITEKLKKIKNVVKGSKTGDLLIQEEKDRNKIFKETRNLLNEMMGSVETLTLQKEIEDLSELNFIHQGEITQLKEALKKKVSKLKLQQNKLTDENKLLIEEIFDRKVAGIQEKLKRDNESLWSRTQEKATKRKTSSPQDSVDLTERISSIARTEKESTKARLRL
jgi:hypothetical protein